MDHSEHHAIMARDFKKRFFIALIISIPVLILSPTIQDWFGFSIAQFTGDKFVLFGLASVIALYTAWPFYTNGLDELKEKQLGMMVLVSLAVLTGYLYSVAATFFIDAPDFYWEISTLTLVLLLGHWLEMRAVVGTSGALKELVKLIPPKANKVKDDKATEVVETAELAVNDLVLVKPGEKVPIDGVVIEGQSSINESLITGESKPVHKSKGDGVIGGSLNIDGALTIKVTKTGDDTALAQIVELVKSAQNSQPKTQKLADRAAHYLTLIAIIVGISTFFVWNFWLGASFVFALTLTITVIVITCPHALGLAIPTVTTITSTLAAKNGILVKDMNGLERAKDVDWILFDKTGTLTQGEFGVIEVVGFSVDEEDVIRTAASLEVKSEHVIAQSIVAQSGSERQKLLDVEEFKAIAGHGVTGRVNSEDVVVGTVKLMQDNGIELKQEQVQRISSLEQSGNTVVYVAASGKLVGVIALSDSIKPESKQAIEELKSLGKQVAMITGDHEVVAKSVSEYLGIDKYFAKVLPEDKVNKVKELQKGGQRVMMVGDGVNDAPALTQAEVGVAIGAGTDVAVASSEIVLVKSNPLDIVKLVKLSQATMRKMKQNLVWATGYNLVAIPVAAGVLASWGFFLRPEWGAIAMTASSIIVVINALLLKRVSLS
jgi:P-type Cu2+ transporter